MESVNGRGSMYGVADSVENMSNAMKEMLKYLPGDSMWPMVWKVSPYQVYAEWGSANDG